MRTNLRPQFDGGASYYKLLELARMIESENFHEDARIEAKPANQKGKTKVGAVTIDNTCLLYTSPSPRDATLSRMPSSA